MMCSSFCTCNIAYRDKFTGIQYGRSIFLPKNPLQADKFYPDCFERKPEGFPELDEKVVKVLHVFEELYHCSGIKEKLMYYATLEVKEGEPEKPCGDVLTKDSQSNIFVTALIMCICAGYIWVLLLF